MAAVASHRLAILDIRAGDIDGARARLRTTIANFEVDGAHQPTAGTLLGTMLPRQPVEA